MGLSRLENFLKSVRGNILYVDPNSLDATDSIENKGNSLTRPFKTIQRALIESARFSYQKGLNNDRFNKTTILVYPGDHVIDNRPGWIPVHDNPVSGSNFLTRSGQPSNDFLPFELSTNFDLSDPSNALYKLNSIHGGVIIPRGTSLVGLDLRKTKIRPKYVPNPQNDNIERTSIFRVTGGCYFWQFSLFDADPTGQCYIDYTNNLFVPNFSHHKLTCFEYADGVNAVEIDDEFITYSTNRTDLDMYYEKIGLAYGPASGRQIEPDYPSSSLDIDAKIDEYRIVGSTGLSVGISSIRSGDGVSPTTTITVTTSSIVPGLDVDTPIRIEGVSSDEYNGSYVVTEKLSDTEITFKVQNPPTVALPSQFGAILSLSSDTVTSASPYIFNISLRSVYGMCGVLADGDKASGFKSMVVAQFTGIGLQKDDNAFVVYDETTGTYQDNTVAGNETISTNSRAIYKPSYRNFHIKCINDAFIQNVSIFAIGYAEHFSAESGGDQSVTNSNSNFGAKSLVASGFRRNAFPQDDYGYITHVIPPKEFPNDEISIEFEALDVSRTISIATTERLYLYNQTNQSNPPEHVIEGYRIGARENDTLKVLISVGGATSEYSSRIVMGNSQTSFEKSFSVGRNTSGINNIGPYSQGGFPDIITLTQAHTFQNGESIRVLSDNGQLPDGLTPNTVYYAITNANTSSGITTNVNILLAKTLNDCLSHTTTNPKNITINAKGGRLKVVSRVSDKNPGDIGHPVQFDSTAGQWYVKVSTASTENKIYPAILGFGVTSLGSATSRTYINRRKYSRNSSDSIYRIRYVIPADTNGDYARPPSDGFILQESNNSTGASDTEIQKYFGSGTIGINEHRNLRFIAGANWSSNTAKIATELPHNLRVGSQVEILNIKSTLNTTGIGNSGYNGTYVVSGISSAKEFSVSLDTDPGTFTNNTALRDTSLPYFKRKRYNNVYYIYRNQESQKYIPGQQDGVYYLTLVNASNNPTVAPFTGESYSQPVKELYPQISRDNPVSDPEEAKSFASSSTIGEVVVNDVRNSITKETVSKLLLDSDVGVGITNIVSTSSTSHTVYTSIDHGLNRITKLNLTYSGVGYGNGTGASFYNVKLVSVGSTVTGKHATAKVSTNASGNITNLTLMDGGSSYSVGDVLTLAGIGTTTGFIPATIQVSQIYNNVGDTIRISGVSSESYNGYNDLYRISGVSVGAGNSFTVFSSKQISGFTTTGIGVTLTQNAFAYLTGQTIYVNTLAYNNVTGLATVTTNNRHGLSVGNKIRISGANQSLYNGDFVVTKTLGLNSFIANVGVSNTSPTATGRIYVYPEGISSNDGLVSSNYENIGGRMNAIYAGITTTLLYNISDEITNEITINGINKLDIKIGDYLQIEDELVRVKTTVPNNIGATDPIYVFRGVLGTKSAKHSLNTVVRKVSVNPIELRRHSIIRASGHTFEYVGFGPGNYSTAFPDKQNRQISAQEELLAQSTRREGGINFYTGMNDKGISYSGNKKLSTVTGQEEIFDTPIQTITGEDIGNEPALNVITPIEGNFSRSIRVDGGSDGNATSEFNGPVVFNDKVTSTSDKGFEVNSLFLQGDVKVSRKYTIGESVPTLAGNPGDVQYNANPSNTDYLGWVYTSNNQWQQFGKIGSAGGGEGQSGVGVGTAGGYVGFSTLINFTGTNISVVSSYNSGTDVTTLNFVGVGTSSILGTNAVGSSSGNRWNVVPIVSTGGTMEIGRYIDFHNTAGDTSDYTYRLDNSSNGVLQTSGSLIVNSNINLTGELNFTGSSDKYVDFYTYDGSTNYTVFLRLLNDANSEFDSGITLARKGAVKLFYSGSEKLSTSSAGITVTGSVSATTGSFTNLSATSGSFTNISATDGNFIGIVTAVDFNSTSDINLKTNIREIENSLDKVLQIRGVNFEWKEDNRSSAGVIAQEIEKVLPELVSNGTTKTVNYNGLVGVLIEAIKEQQSQIEELRQQIKNNK